MPAPEWLRDVVEHSEEFVRPLAQVEKEHILNAMILCKGNLKLATERLGISSATLYRRLEEYADKEEGAPAPHWVMALCWLEVKDDA